MVKRRKKVWVMAAKSGQKEEHSIAWENSAVEIVKNGQDGENVTRCGGVGGGGNGVGEAV